MVWRIGHIGLMLAVAPCALAADWSGSIALQSRLFPSPPALEEQHEDSLSLSFDPEFYHEWEERNERFLFAPHLRIDQHDHERTAFDIRELFWQKSAENWELRLGWRKVYWGVTESQHLVDIINQTDLVASPDGEEKLGQLMLNYALVKDWGTIDVFVMPGFRERTFPGRHGRLRPPSGWTWTTPSTKAVPRNGIPISPCVTATTWATGISAFPISGVPAVNRACCPPSTISACD